MNKRNIHSMLLTILGLLILVSVGYFIYSLKNDIVYLHKSLLSKDQKIAVLEDDLENLRKELSNQGVIDEKIEELKSGIEQKDAENTQRQEELEKQIRCQKLVKVTPESGPGKYIGADIVGFYNDTKSHYEDVIKGKFTRENDKEDNAAELKFWTELYNESKPLYEKYISECEN